MRHEYTGETIRLLAEDETEHVVIITEDALRYVMEEILPRLLGFVAFSLAGVVWFLVLSQL